MTELTKPTLMLSEIIFTKNDPTVRVAANLLMPDPMNPASVTADYRILSLEQAALPTAWVEDDLKAAFVAQYPAVDVFWKSEWDAENQPPASE